MCACLLISCPFYQVGDRITAGDIYGVVFENSLVEHRIMLPPGARGNISYVAPAGHYNVEEEVIEVDFQGTKKVRGLRVLLIHPGCCLHRCISAALERGGKTFATMSISDLFSTLGLTCRSTR